MNLFKQLYAARRDVYYCDTDSIITTEELPSDPKRLGALKKEKEVVLGRFVACKVYVTQEEDSHREMKAKGFSRVNYKKFLDVEAGRPIPLSRMTRIRELARKGDIRPQESIVEKRLVQNCLPKRCPLPGGQTRPWTIEEIDHDHAIDGVVMPMPEWA